MIIAADPLAVSAVVDGHTVIMGSDMQFVRVDAVGAVIWELISAGNDIDGVTLAITERYDVDPETARRDVEEFVEHLSNAGLVTVSS